MVSLSVRNLFTSTALNCKYPFPYDEIDVKVKKTSLRNVSKVKTLSLNYLECKNNARLTELVNIIQPSIEIVSPSKVSSLNLYRSHFELNSTRFYQVAWLIIQLQEEMISLHKSKGNVLKTELTINHFDMVTGIEDLTVDQYVKLILGAITEFALDKLILETIFAVVEEGKDGESPNTHLHSIIIYSNKGIPKTVAVRFWSLFCIVAFNNTDGHPTSDFNVKAIKSAGPALEYMLKSLGQGNMNFILPRLEQHTLGNVGHFLKYMHPDILLGWCLIQEIVLGKELKSSVDYYSLYLHKGTKIERVKELLNFKEIQITLCPTPSQASYKSLRETTDLKTLLSHPESFINYLSILNNFIRNNLTSLNLTLTTFFCTVTKIISCNSIDEIKKIDKITHPLIVGGKSCGKTSFFNYLSSEVGFPLYTPGDPNLEWWNGYQGEHWILLDDVNTGKTDSLNNLSLFLNLYNRIPNIHAKRKYQLPVPFPTNLWVIHVSNYIPVLFMNRAPLYDRVSLYYCFPHNFPDGYKHFSWTPDLLLGFLTLTHLGKLIMTWLRVEKPNLLEELIRAKNGFLTFNLFLKGFIYWSDTLSLEDKKSLIPLWNLLFILPHFDQQMFTDLFNNRYVITKRASNARIYKNRLFHDLSIAEALKSYNDMYNINITELKRLCIRIDSNWTPWVPGDPFCEPSDTTLR